LAIDGSPTGALSVACAQLAPVFGDLDGNRARAAGAVRAAAQAGATLIVLPELCITGYVFEDEAEARSLAEPVDGVTVTQWQTLAAGLGVIIVGGICELDADGALRNSAVVVDPDGLRCVYRKTHLWDREKLIFEAGPVPAPVLDTAFGRLGLAICYDAFFPEVMRALALDGAEVIAVPMNSPAYGPPPGPLWMEVVQALASASVNRVFVAQCDRAGHERGVDWVQASVICDPDGRMLAGPVEGVALLTAGCDLAMARAKSFGTRNHVLTDRRPELYGDPGRPLSTKETVL
jgi:predicted amidohydrolase